MSHYAGDILHNQPADVSFLSRGKFISGAAVRPKHPKPFKQDALMTKILPTVGRVVLFTPSRLTGDYGFAHIDSRKPLAAIVAHVFNTGW